MALKIYIASNFKGEPTGVLLADSQEKAELVWLGAGQSPHSVDVIDPASTALGVHGVVTLLSSQEVRKIDLDHKSRDWSFRLWKRGL